MELDCYKCKKENSFPYDKLPFRASCDYCLTDLHVCKNCKYYSVGKPNDCYVPGTDPVLDKEKNNLCEEFRLKPFHEPEEHSSVDDVHNKLFGDTEEELKKTNNFEDLFNGD